MYFQLCYPLQSPRVGISMILSGAPKDGPGALTDMKTLRTAYETVGFDVLCSQDCSAQVRRREGLQ